MPTAEDALAAAVASLGRTSRSAECESFLHRLGAAELSLTAKGQLLDEYKRRTKRPLGEARAVMALHARGIPGRGAPGWHADAAVGRDGQLLGNAATVLACFRGDRMWRGVIAYDEFHRQVWLRSKPPWEGRWDGPRALTDSDEAQILVALQQAGIDCRIEATRHAIAVRMWDTPFHPIRDYLDRLKWDGRDRLANAPASYLGVALIPGNTDVVFKLWMISAVARIFRPGCMAKYCLILEGKQDLRKSMALEILGYPWFTDDIATLGSKDAALQVNNAWIVEFADFDTLERSELSAIKAFISRKTDRIRVPYGLHPQDFPRENVLSATINPAGEYFIDTTGNVRYWPLACTSINTEALIMDRDQLWAEAVALYNRGVKWWLDGPVAAVEEEQERRQIVHPWAELIRNWLANCARSEVTLAEVMRDALNMREAEMNRRGDQTVVGRCVTAAGWVKTTRPRLGKNRVWVYSAPS